MKSERTVIIVVAAVLLVLCSLASCVVGLVAASALYLLPVRQQTRVDEWWPEMMTPEVRRVPQDMPRAALVTQVVDGSPADEAGIEVGNMILAIDGQGIAQDQDLRELFSRYEPGDEITIVIWDGSAERRVEVTLGERPDDSTAPYLGVEYRMTLYPF